MADCYGGSEVKLPFTIKDVAALDGYLPRRNLLDSMYTDCNICGDKRGKMNINFAKDVWRCNYCGAGGGPLALYAKPRGITTEVAFWEICAALFEGDAPPASKQGYTVPEILEKRTLTEVPVLPMSIVASAADIHNTLSTLLSLLPLKPRHRAELQRRGLTDEQVAELGYKSTPAPFLCPSLCARLVELGCVLRGVPGFYVNDAGVWTIRFGRRTAGFIIPCKGMDGLMCGAQIRLDVPLRDTVHPEKEGAKYLWLSSAGKYMGSPFVGQLHFAGSWTVETIYVTEGLLKSDIAHLFTGRTFIGIAGANNTERLDSAFAYLAAHNTRTIVEALDMDKFRNVHVHKGAANICRLAQKKGLRAIQLTWNPNHNGIDDWRCAVAQRALVVGKPPTFKTVFLSGKCDVEDMASFAGSWDSSREDQTLYEHLGLTQHEYEVYQKNGEGQLRRELLNQRKELTYRIYQLDFTKTGEPKPFAFADFKAVMEAGYTQPPASEYSLAYEGAVCCNKESDDLSVVELLRAQYSEDLPNDYQGRSIAPSDVIELCDEWGRRYYYCNKNGAVSVKFSALLVTVLEACA